VDILTCIQFITNPTISYWVVDDSGATALKLYETPSDLTLSAYSVGNFDPHTK